MRADDTLIIVPTLNEAENVGLLLPEIAKHVGDAHILVVDDESSDGTAARAREIGHEISNPVEVAERRGEPGLGRAYSHGFRHGLERGYNTIVTMDADLSHNPEYLPEMLAKLSEADLVIGSRYIAGGGVVNWPKRRVLLSWTANHFARLLLGLKGHDLTSGFRAYRRSVLTEIDLDGIRSNGYSFLVEVLYHASRPGRRVAEVPIIFHDRSHGTSKISKREIYRGALTLGRLRLRG